MIVEISSAQIAVKLSKDHLVLILMIYREIINMPFDAQNAETQMSIFRSIRSRMAGQP